MGWYPRVRIGKKRVRVPVLVTLGVCADGRLVILDLRLAGVESERARRDFHWQTPTGAGATR